MTEKIEGKDITTFINDSLATIVNSDNIKKIYDALILVIRDTAKKRIKFIDAIDIYAFGLCLVNQMVKTKGDELTPYWPIFYKINKYLYKKQCDAEKNFVNYTPHTKEVIAEILSNPETDIPVQKTDTYKIPETITIPKLETDILTEPKLLRTSGLMNPDIAKLLGDGKFIDVDTLPLEQFSLQNQFNIRCRKSKIMPITYSNQKKINDIIIDLCNNLIDEKNNPLIKYYYLFNFYTTASNEIIPMFLLNSICHVEFNKGFEFNLKKKILSPAPKSRYIFTFGLFSSFKTNIMDFIGTQHRCALIFDTKDKKIYLYDTYLEQSIELYMFDHPDKPTSAYNSVIIACDHQFKKMDFLNGYRFFLKDIPMQHHDVFYKNIMLASTYYRYYNNYKTYLDWSGGYCGTQVLLLLVLISLNLNVELESILGFLDIISRSPIKNYPLLILLIRSFAYQIEQISYHGKKEIDTQEFDLKQYIISKGESIKINSNELILKHTSIPEEFEFDILSGNEALSSSQKRQHQTVKGMLITEKNEPNVLKNDYDILKKPIDKVYSLANISLLLTTIVNMFKKVDKLKIKMTPAQRQWIFDHYGPDNLITFIKY